MMDKQENKIMGTVGAVAGAFLGIVVWCLLGKLGVISWIGGLAIVGLSFGGYMLLGKEISKFGAVLIILLAVISVYIATRLNWAIALQEIADDLTLFESYDYVMDLLELAGEKGEFYKDLVFGYAVTVAAGFSMFKKALG